MSTSLSTLIRLRGIQNKVRKLFEGMNDETYRDQYHPDLSPLGWHLGHCLFIENYWLHEVLQGDDSLTADQQDLFVPENCPKPERGVRLPALQQQLKTIHQQHDDNDLLLIEMVPPLSEHELLKDEYLQNFIIQHYAQHYETMQMVFNQIAIQSDDNQYRPQQPLHSKPLLNTFEAVEAAEVEIGGEAPFAYDNELPRQQIHLDSFSIANKPVSNAEYLRFIEDQGYKNRAYWSTEGWQWRLDNNIHQPEHWKQNERGEWYAACYPEAIDLVADAPVYGISYYESSAFAHWAQARLPHEYEWETSARQNKLHHSGLVWEWCNNVFSPYEGFQAFPYDGYSKPWFDGKHFVLRGASQFTRPEIRRASFRNFFNPDKRHIFAGLRLVLV